MRPEDLSGSGGDSSLNLKVDVLEQLGGTTFVYGHCAGMDNFVVERPGSEVIGMGADLTISINADRCYLFDQDGLAYQRA